MAEIQKHTPLPWAVNPFRAQIDAFAGGRPLAVCQLLWPTDQRSEAETEANAAFIVRAVNEYDGLRERVKVLEQALREIASQCHNLPRGATADRIEALARSLSPSSPTHGQDSNKEGGQTPRRGHINSDFGKDPR